MQELEHWKTRFDIAGAATEGFFSKQWLAKTLFGMSDGEFIKNRREMFYDKKFEAALETAGEAEQAEQTAGLDAGPDDLGGGLASPGGDLGTPGGTGTAGTEPELAATPAATPAETPAAPEAQEGDLLTAPPGKREDSKGRTTTAKSHGWYEPRDTKAGGDRRKSSGPRKKTCIVQLLLRLEQQENFILDIAS